MAAPPSPSGFFDLRNTFQERRDLLDQKRYELARARQALAEVVRLFPEQSDERTRAAAALQGAAGAELGARTAESEAKVALANAIQTWLEDDATSLPLEPDADLGRLGRTDVPVLLLPLRLETRFDVPQRTLRVRIYPDEIWSNLHERALLPEERAAGDA